MKEPLISVVIPVYNVEKYLKKCLDSVVNQTYKNIEVIIIDDGSTDNSGKICDEYSKKDSRLKVIHKKNTGLSDARNKGIELVKGKYLTFIDSDDYVTNDYIEYLYGLIVKNKANLSICNFNIVWKKFKQKKESKNKEFIFTSEQAFRNLLFSKGIDVAACEKMYKTSLWKNIRFPFNKFYEDTATIYKLIHKAKKIAYGEKSCYYYVARENSISKQGRFNKKELDYMRHTKVMLNFIKKRYPNLKLAVDRYSLYSNFRILRMLVFTKTKNKKLEQDLIKSIREKQTKVFFLKETPIRDKIAIISLFFGKSIFKIAWKIYVKMTGRIL